jgi:ribulose bisphosphate carboxylase small subunit
MNTRNEDTEKTLIEDVNEFKQTNFNDGTRTISFRNIGINNIISIIIDKNKHPYTYYHSHLFYLE